MADGLSAGSVAVDVGANLVPLQAGLDRAEAMVRAFDARLASSVASVPGISNATTSLNTVIDQTTASLTKMTAPAATAAAQVGILAASGGAVSVSAKTMAAALEAAGGDLSKITPAMLGLATAETAVADTARAATVATAQLGAAAVETATLTHRAQGEFVTLGLEIARGNFSRIPTSIGVLGKSLGAAGTSALTLKNVLGGLGVIAETAFSPVVLGFLAISTGLDLGIKAFAKLDTAAVAATEALDRQKQLVEELTAAYPKLGKALKDALAQPASDTENQLLVTSQKAIDAAQRNVASLTASLKRQVQDAFAPSFGTMSALALYPKLADEVKALNDRFQSGSITATTFGDKLAGLELDPKLQGLAKAFLDQLVQITQQIAAAQVQATAFASTIEALRAGGGLIIGSDFSQLKSVTDLVDSLRKMAPDLRTPAQQAIDYYNQNSGLDTTGEGKTELNYVLQQIKAQQNLKTSIKATTEAQREAADLAKRVAAANDNAAFDAQTLGMNSQERSVADTIKSVYGGAWQSQMQSTLAQQLRVNAALSDFKDTAEQASNTFASTFLSDLRQGQSVISSFGDAAISALDDISNKLIQMAIDNLWSDAFGGATSGGSSGSGGIFGAIASLFGSGVPAFASGTDYAPGGLAIVGERGPELVHLPAGAGVSSASKTAAMLGAAANNGAANGNGFVINVSIDAKGAELGADVRIARAVRDTFRNHLPQAIAEYQRNTLRRGYTSLPPV